MRMVVTDLQPCHLKNLFMQMMHSMVYYSTSTLKIHFEKQGILDRVYRVYKVYWVTMRMVVTDLQPCHLKNLFMQMMHSMVYYSTSTLKIHFEKQGILDRVYRVYKVF